MKFVLNTSLDPHFCALFTDDDVLIEKLSWMERSKDSENIYNFLAKQNPAKISFCGGVTGPGGFASLRAAACILTSISTANKIGINQISAEEFVSKLLGNDNFLLNSFGNSVWKKNKEKISREFIEDIDLEKEWFVDFLPENKKNMFSSRINVKIEEIELKLLKCLLDKKNEEFFVPHYEVAPV